MLWCLIVSVAVAADTTPRVSVDILTPYTSSQWDLDKWSELGAIRPVLGTMVSAITQYNPSSSNRSVWSIEWSEGDLSSPRTATHIQYHAI